MCRGEKWKNIEIVSNFSSMKSSALCYSPADWCKNCGIYGKSTKFCTKIENYLLNNISYGPTWDLSHNCNYNGFKVAHYTSNMETRLGELFIYFQQSEKEIDKLNQKMNFKMHSETLLAFLCDRVPSFGHNNLTLALLIFISIIWPSSYIETTK